MVKAGSAAGWLGLSVPGIGTLSTGLPVRLGATDPSDSVGCSRGLDSARNGTSHERTIGCAAATNHVAAQRRRTVRSDPSSLQRC